MSILQSFLNRGSSYVSNTCACNGIILLEWSERIPDPLNCCPPVQLPRPSFVCLNRSLQRLIRGCPHTKHSLHHITAIFNPHSAMKQVSTNNYPFQDNKVCLPNSMTRAAFLQTTWRPIPLQLYYIPRLFLDVSQQEDLHMYPCRI